MRCNEEGKQRKDNLQDLINDPHIVLAVRWPDFTSGNLYFGGRVRTLRRRSLTAEDAMADLFEALMTVDEFTVFVTLSCVGIAFWLIREMVDSTALAIVCAPVLLIGALAANYLFRIHFVIAVQDKDSNVVVASAVGVVCALVLVLVSLWISVLMSERLSARRKLEQLPTAPSATPVPGQR